MSVTYPQSDWNVVSLKYSYDKNKWLQDVTTVLKDGKEATIRTYSYDEYGDVSEIKDYRALSENGDIVSNPSYTVCTYTYDEYRRPVSMSYTDSDEPENIKESYSYEYDKNSRIIKETIQNFYPEKEEDKQQEVRNYTYDNQGSLLQMQVENVLHDEESYTVSYTYDAVGNRLSQVKEMLGDKETTDYSYNSLNQLMSSITRTSDGTVTEQKSYIYDVAGSQTKETDSISNTVADSTYDVAGRLKSYTKTEAGKVTVQQSNQYNGSGARIQKVEDGKTTNYYYSQGGLLYTEDEAGKGTSLNLQGISGNIIATAREDDVKESYYYYHKDAAGSTSNVRDADGKSVVSYQYTDFGETTIGGNQDFYNEICYNGAVYDKSTGLYYLNARYYDPEDGRFISRDSYRGNQTNPSTLHLYAYCANNPINYKDPSGHIAISKIVGGIIGGVAGGFVGSKIAKKAKLKGWKKVAVIAGCTIGGAVIGAFAGPKVAKKAAKYVKRKLPSTVKKLKSAKKTVKKAKTVVKKGASKTKTVIKKAAKKKAKKVAYKTVEGGVKGAVKSELKNENVRKGTINGMVNGGVSEMLNTKSKLANAGLNAAYSWTKAKYKGEDTRLAVEKSLFSSGTSAMIGGARSKWLGEEPAKDWVDKAARKAADGFEKSYNVIADVLIDNFVK